MNNIKINILIEYKRGLRTRSSNIHRKTPDFIKKRLQHRCFPVNIAKFLRTAFFIEHLRWLLIKNDSFKGTNILKLKLVKICNSMLSFLSRLG